MRICFTSDFHGHEVLYGALSDLLASEAPDLLILGGDMFADGVEPDPPASQRAYVREHFAPRLERWKRDHLNMTVAAILGNHDWVTTRDELSDMHERAEMVLLDPRRPWRRDGIGFLGFWHTPPTPFHVKDYERRDQADDPVPAGSCWVWDESASAAREIGAADHYGKQASLSHLLQGLPAVEAPWIFVCHAPPHRTRLDHLPGIEFPVGSKAVRRFIESRHPFLALHGHIHESPMITGAFRDRVGSTLCVNPGQADEQLHAVVLDTEDPTGSLRHTVFA